MIFHAWNSVWNIEDNFYVIVNDKYMFEPKHKNIQLLSEFDINKKNDFIVDNDLFLFYIAYKREIITYKIPPHFVTFIFKKNKLYDFKNWIDELGNPVEDVWYDPFLFIYEKDYNKATRYLKLKKLKQLENHEEEI